MIVLWLEQFAPHDKFVGLAVEQDGALLAALPLVATRVKGMFTVGGAVANCWSAAGQLLVDPLADEAALDLLARGIAQLPWPLVWLEGVNPQTESWRRLLAACDRQGLTHEFRHDREVGLIDIGHNWPAYEDARSTNHKRTLRRARERLLRDGVHFRTMRPCDPAEAESLLRRAFEVEERSWKAAEGTAITHHPEALAFFVQQARQLAACGALDLCWLELEGRPIAYEYGYRAKGVHLAHKTGYDEAFASASPGHFLMHELLKTFHEDPGLQLVDCLGPMNAALQHWTTRTYCEGRLLIVPRRVWSRTLWLAYQCAKSRPRTSLGA
jgi:hypothetical protein